MNRLAALSLFAVLVALVSGCAVEIDEREVLIRHDVERDQLDLLFVQRGVSAPRGFFPKKKQQDALELAQLVLDGRRQAGFGFPLDFDLDSDELQGEERERLSHITLEAVAPFLDEGDRLSWFQHFRVPDASATIEWLNTLFNEYVVAELENDEEKPFAERWVKAARNRWRWIEFRGTQFVFRAPMTPEDFAQVFEDVASGEESVGVLEGLHALSVADGIAEFTYGEPDSTVIRLRLAGNGEYDDRLLRDLEAAGHEIRKISELERVRATFYRD